MTSYYYSDPLSPALSHVVAKQAAGAAHAQNTTLPGGAAGVSFNRSTVPDISSRKWSWCSTVWSFIVLVLGMLWCGVAGLVCSLAAYADHRALEFRKERSKLRTAWCCVLTGILVFMLMIAGALVALTLYLDQTKDFFCDKLQFNCN